tara:strand:+ start:2712 stop:2852 length:141 start_codon:yes stop_codon:yes gene_type:complete
MVPKLGKTITNKTPSYQKETTYQSVTAVNNVTILCNLQSENLNTKK